MQVLIVTGGRVIDSTELYLWGDTQWTRAAPLPTARDGVRGVTLGNNFFVTGVLGRYDCVYELLKGRNMGGHEIQ